MNPSSSSQPPKHLDPSAQEFHPTLIPLLIPAPLFPFPQPPHLLLPAYPLPPPTAFFHLIPPPPPSPPPTTTNSPSRTLLLTSLPPYTTEHSVVSNMSSFGEIRAVEMDRVYDGVVTVHFYDLRDAQTALGEIRAQHFDGCPVWAQFIIPDALHSVHDPLNHGTIVIFNLDPHVPDHSLKRIFQAFGPVKELRDTPSKRKQKFLEYFDVRDAEKAAIEMNRKMIHGKQITVDFSRPGGGHGRRWRIESDDVFLQSNLRQSQSTPASYREPSRNISCTNIDNNITPGAVTNAAVPRSNTQAQRPTRTARTTTSDDINGREGGGTNATVEDSMSSWGNVSVQNGVVLNTNVVRKVASGVWNKKKQLQGLGRNKRRLMDLKFLIQEDVITGCGDSRTTLMIKNIPNKYSQKLMLSLLDNHCAHCNDQILSGQGGVEGGCLSSYDFVYLPMDFNNKCNVGYGFVNMTSPEATVRLYKDFHRKSWEVFNSRKICEVTYARVQGLQALKDHFRNSKFPSGSDDIFPVVFEPPRDGRGHMTQPQPIYGLTTAGSVSSENGSSNTCSSGSVRSNVGSYSNEGSQGCVDEVFSALRVEKHVTEVVEHNGGVDEVR